LSVTIAAVLRDCRYRNLVRSDDDNGVDCSRDVGDRHQHLPAQGHADSRSALPASSSAPRQRRGRRRCSSQDGGGRALGSAAAATAAAADVQRQVEADCRRSGRRQRVDSWRSSLRQAVPDTNNNY